MIHKQVLSLSHDQHSTIDSLCIQVLNDPLTSNLSPRQVDRCESNSNTSLEACGHDTFHNTAMEMHFLLLATYQAMLQHTQVHLTAFA